MGALLAFILSNQTVLEILGVVLGAIGLAFHQRRAGAKAERAKQIQEEAEARDIKDQVQNDVGSLPDDKARKELGKWAR